MLDIYGKLIMDYYHCSTDNQGNTLDGPSSTTSANNSKECRHPIWERVQIYIHRWDVVNNLSQSRCTQGNIIVSGHTYPTKCNLCHIFFCGVISCICTSN